MKSTATNYGILTIFGITGDLARRYLLPALYHLSTDNLLPAHFEIIGVTRRGTTVPKLMAGIKTEIETRGGKCDPSSLKRLAAMIRIVKMDTAKREDYDILKATLDTIEDQHKACLNRLFYLSIPPEAFGQAVDFLAESGLGSGCQHGTADSRLMVEKPFGYDTASARKLIERLTRHFTEAQIFRIDHYLAKETAQNILVFRFSNPIFADIWNRDCIDQIIVSASESIGIEGRVSFYEPTGALRDLIQSHLLQVLALVTMDEPKAMDSDQIHAQKLRLLSDIKPISSSQVRSLAIHGQYQGYTGEVENPDSITETFARLNLSIENDRWRGVPIIVQTGKRLHKKATEVTIVFGDRRQLSASNTLTFRIQPNEGIAIDLLAKKPGFSAETERVEMTFDYHHHFGAGSHPDAYERVLIDGIRGDHTLFATSDEVVASWQVVDAVVHEWAKSSDDLIIYKPGSTPDEIVSQRS